MVKSDVKILGNQFRLECGNLFSEVSLTFDQYSKTTCSLTLRNSKLQH